MTVITGSDEKQDIFRMSSGVSNCHTVSQYVLNVLMFYFCHFFLCSAYAFDMCLLNYLLTYLL